jgi:hypothetical protein
VTAHRPAGEVRPDGEPTIRHSMGHRVPAHLWPAEVGLLKRLARPNAALHWRRLVLSEDLGYPPDSWFLVTSSEESEGRQLVDVEHNLALNLLHDGYLSGPTLCHGGRSAYVLNDYGHDALASRAEDLGL